MGVNWHTTVGRVLAPWVVALAAYGPVEEHAGPVFAEAGKAAYEVHRGVEWLSEDLPDHVRGLIGKQTELDGMIRDLESLGVDSQQVSAFETSYRSTRSIEQYLNAALNVSAKTTMDLNEAIRQAAPWLEPVVRYTGMLHNDASQEQADAYQEFIDEMHAFRGVARTLPDELGVAIIHADADRASHLIKEYTSISQGVAERGLRYHDEIGETLVTLQDELRSELGEERYEQLRRYNEHERERWGSLASLIGSAATAGMAGVMTRRISKPIGAAAGSMLGYLGKKRKKESAPNPEEEPELKWS